MRRTRRAIGSLLGVQGKVTVQRAGYALGALVRRTGRREVVRCDAPVVLVSQIQRSGGTLLSQLFDHHPQLLVHPHEFQWGKPKKWDWPESGDVRGRSHRALWAMLQNPFIDRAIREGYRKGEFSQPLPFLFDRDLQYRTFRDLVRAGVTTQRQVLDCYMTAFFHAWLDYQNLYQVPKRYTVAFTPRVTMYTEYVARFFRDYPDGFLISIVRDPLSWYASAKKHVRSQDDMRDKEPTHLMAFWRESIERVLENRRRHAERYLVVRFEDLVRRTEDVMRALCRRLDLPFDPILLRPTFNSIDIAANTSHAALKEERGVVASTLEVYREVLTEVEREAIAAEHAPAYVEAGEGAVR